MIDIRGTAEGSVSMADAEMGDLQSVVEAVCASGAFAILKERQRQAKFWTLEHDDSHMQGELAIQAAALAVNHTDYQLASSARFATRHGLQPLEMQGDVFGLAARHAPDPIRSLVIAGALIAAEIDRLQRLRSK